MPGVQVPWIRDVDLPGTSFLPPERRKDYVKYDKKPQR